MRGVLIGCIITAPFWVGVGFGVHVLWPSFDLLTSPACWACAAGVLLASCAVAAADALNERVRS